MRITILALGSQGDVQPLIPLGRGLQAAGHTVRLATFAAFRNPVEQACLDFFPLEGDAHALLGSATNAGLLAERTNPLRAMRALRQSYAALADDLARDLSDPVLQDTQLLLNQLPGNLYGDDLAEYLSIPSAMVAVIPLVPTRYQPFIGFPPILSPVPGYNRFTYTIARQAMWFLFRAAINRWRVKRLGLTARPLVWRPVIAEQRVPVINGFSPRVVPRPPDWGEHIHITGWWYPHDPDWEPSDELQRFLAAGSPPVFIGFGSMLVPDKAQATRLIVEAIRLSGQRAIMHVGWAGLGQDLPSNIYMIDYAPYEWLFPRMAAVVHHGGSGTTSFALRAGVPSLAVPFGFDQFYWGARTAELGVGPAPIPFAKLTAGGLAMAIEQAVSEPAFQGRARVLGEELAAECGIGQAVEIISQFDK